MKRKLGVLLILAVALLLIVSCRQGTSWSDMEIGPGGAGTKTIHYKWEKDSLATEADLTKGDLLSKFFPQGEQAVADWLQDQVPAGFVVEYNGDLADYHEITISYSFTDIDDYNAKTKMMIPTNIWEDNFLEEATLTSEAVTGGFNLTFRESLALLKYSGYGYFLSLYEQTDIFDKTRDGYDDGTAYNPDNQFDYMTVIVTVGDESLTIEAGKNVNTGEWDSVDPNAYIELTGFVAEAEATATPEPTSAEATPTTSTNPTTPDAGMVPAILAAAFGLSTLVMAVRRKKA